MYVFIIKAGDTYVAGTTRNPAQYLHSYRTGDIEDAPPYVCSMADYMFVYPYHEKLTPKIRAFLDTLSETTLAYYAKQEPHVLVAWFNRVAGIAKPKRFESELIENDVCRLLNKFNSGLRLV